MDMDPAEISTDDNANESLYDSFSREGMLTMYGWDYLSVYTLQ